MGAKASQLAHFLKSDYVKSTVYHNTTKKPIFVAGLMEDILYKHQLHITTDLADLLS